MKLPLLLAQFLYQTKKLNLPGIGSFTLDPAVPVPANDGKDQDEPIQGLKFVKSGITQPDNALIDFIKANTGKIRPLAMADLESYLTLGMEMLNIGKPFHLEGIGTLTKSQDGNFEFSPGYFAVSSMEEAAADRPEKPVRKKVVEDTSFEHESAPSGPSSRRGLVVLAIIAGLALAGWGGWYMYKQNAAPVREASQTAVDTTVQIKDTSAAVAAPVDSSSLKPVPNVTDSHAYKFIILETHNKERALRRYNQLLSYDLKVNLFTTDSTYFKVYFTFPALAKDTIHIKDSLRREYAHEVIIEH